MKSTLQTTAFQFPLSDLLLHLGKQTSQIQPEELNVVISLVRKALGRGIIQVEIAVKKGTIIHIRVDNNKLSQPICTLDDLIKSMEKMQDNVTEILDTENKYTQNQRREAKSILNKLSKIGDIEAREKCNELDKYSDKPEKLTIKRIKKLEIDCIGADGAKNQVISSIRLNYQGQKIVVRVDKSKSRECEELLSLFIRGHVELLDLHVIAHITPMGKLDIIELVKLEQSQ